MRILQHTDSGTHCARSVKCNQASLLGRPSLVSVDVASRYYQRFVRLKATDGCMILRLGLGSLITFIPCGYKRGFTFIKKQQPSHYRGKINSDCRRTHSFI